MIQNTELSAFASKKVAAGICGILLGSLGIHKFILGLTNGGLIMLLVSLIGGVMTCGVASAIMGLIGLIEGIIYLTKPDEVFYQEYAVQKKQWF
ncbi:TM2 domain-containing protein [bacterium]|nr:TM2 domain-containing protein [bacterium]